MFVESTILGKEEERHWKSKLSKSGSKLSKELEIEIISLTMENIQQQNQGTWETILKLSENSKSRSKFLEEVLRRATFTKSLNIMKKLIVDEKIDPNAKAFDGTTAIKIAARQRDPTTLKFLLSLSEKININIQDGIGQTPLILACRLAGEEVVQVLIRCPTIDVNMADNRGKTALRVACLHGHDTIVSMLLGHEQIQVNKGDFDNKSPLMVACSLSNIGVVRLLLNREDIDVNAKNKYNETALTNCCIPETPAARRLLTLYGGTNALARSRKRVKNQAENISMLLQREELEISARTLQAMTYFVMNTFDHSIDIRDARDMRALIDEAVSRNLLDIARWLLKTEGYLFRGYTTATALWGSSAAAHRPLRRRFTMEADLDKVGLMSFEEFAQVLKRRDVEKKMSIRFLNQYPV